LDSVELYDLAGDPAEMVDLSRKQAERTLAMYKFAKEWLAASLADETAVEASGLDRLDEETLQGLRSLGYVD
jgi:hypothetical protein